MVEAYPNRRGARIVMNALTDPHLLTFEEHRALLFGIAWRMVGNAADAEDLVQESLIRWQNVDGSNVRSPRAFLVTMVTRLCLNHLDLARVKNERALGTELAL